MYTHNAPNYNDIVVLKQWDKQELETKDSIAYGLQKFYDHKSMATVGS